MNLRSSKTLKLFVILLFSFGMIAPALMSSANELSDGTQIYSNEAGCANVMSSLLFEENGGEEERESKDHKSTLSVISFDFFEAYIQPVKTGSDQTTRVEPSDASTSQPPLFTLFHTYLI